MSGSPPLRYLTAFWCVFFSMFLTLSFIQIRFWHSQSYLIYILFFILLLGVKYFGLTSSGSKRWLDLYFMNLQPSELMKIAIIVCFARYFHREQMANINSFKNVILSMAILLLPILLVVSQPDLGTSILIAISGIIVLWLAGFNIKYFIYSGLALIISLPFVISMLKP